VRGLPPFFGDGNEKEGKDMKEFIVSACFVVRGKDKEQVRKNVLSALKGSVMRKVKIETPEELSERVKTELENLIKREGRSGRKGES
jgi:hypothetical protein